MTDCVGSWELGRVHNVAANDLIAGLPDQSVNCVLVDPPYGLAGRVFEFPHHQYSAVNEAWDHEALVDWMALTPRTLAPGGSVICFGGRKSVYAVAAEGLRLGWKLINDVTWEKPDAPPNFTGRMLTESTERALVFCPSGTGWTYNLEAAKAMNGGKNLRDVWRFKIARQERIHPTRKPEPVMERCVQLFTRPGDLVVDLFSGSGTTGVAAIRNGRRFVGSELDAGYAAAANLRLDKPFMPMMFPDELSEVTV